MSASVTENTSGPKNQKLCRSRLQCAQPPTRPSARNSTASPLCAARCSPWASRIHCHRKYVHHMSTCPVNGACRSDRSGLPYCSRLMFDISRSYVTRVNVHDASSLTVHAVGSPSLMAGKCAARIGW
jgi:hypothetical protein